MLAVLGVMGYIMAQRTIDADPNKKAPIIDYSKRTAVMENKSYLPGNIHTEFQEKATFGTKDPAGLRLPYGSNPRSGTVNIFGTTSTLQYQEAYLKNLNNMQTGTDHPLIDPAFQSPYNNYSQQGHQVIYPNVQGKIAAMDKILMPHYSDAAIREDFHGILRYEQNRPTYLPGQTK